jgi:hypothetical protein
MITELGTSIWLTVSFIQFWTLNALGLALVVGVWISTFAIQLPLHRKLQKQYSPGLISRVNQTNWIRTILWTLKAGVGIYILLDL